MNGLSKIALPLLLLLPLSVNAEEQIEINVPSVSVGTVGINGKIDATEAVSVEDKAEGETAVVEAQIVTVDAPLEASAPTEVVDSSVNEDQKKAEVARLLETAKRENVNRTNMKRANLSETECLAHAIYHEARGEGHLGMLAVAFVIYNRVTSNGFPTSFCGVVLQKSQFSFIGDRNPDNIKEWAIYEKVLAMAVDLVENDGFQRKASPVGNALFFNSFRSRSGWSYAKARKFIATIGNHHFFK